MVSAIAMIVAQRIGETFMKRLMTWSMNANISHPMVIVYA